MDIHVRWEIVICVSAVIGTLIPGTMMVFVLLTRSLTAPH